ncbi:MAG: S24 family peptidase [Clostridia bacterium]|nr:S24 family peptidase [Clostridia bacterium]
MKTRIKNPELMNRIIDYVGEYYRNNRTSPSSGNIAKALGIAKTTAYNYLCAMNENGMISYNGSEIGKLSKIELSKTEYFSCPLVGSVKCGDPEVEEENVEMYISLPRVIFGNGDFYILRASGDSMVDVGIDDGDLVLIKKQHHCEVGDIVVALDENNENTLKTYIGIDKKSGMALLKYENKSVYGDKTIPVKQLTIQGVAVNVISELPCKSK